jgi:hypothetical protein
VVYSIPLLDSFIRLAQRDLCAVRWTAAILEEAQRTLIRHRGDEARIRQRFFALRAHFDDWEITGYEALIPSMRCDDKYRHVLAAAVRGGASQIVTANVRDFPQVALKPYDLEAVAPDVFTGGVAAWALQPTQAQALVTAVAKTRRSPRGIGR